MAEARRLRGEFLLDAAAAEFESAASRAESKLRKGWSEGAVGDALVCLHGLLLCRKDQGQQTEALAAVQRAIVALDTVGPIGGGAPDLQTLNPKLLLLLSSPSLPSLTHSLPPLSSSPPSPLFLPPTGP